VFSAGVFALVAVLAGASSAGPAAALPGANGKIAYTIAVGETTEIFVVNADGSEPVNVTNDPASDLTAAWSPDGSKIAFASDRDGDLEVYVMNADGSDVVQLTDNDALDCCARWSPDGTRLVFHSNRTENLDIFVMEADGSDVVALTDGPAFDAYPDWSPDGTRIVFESDRAGDSQLFAMNPEGLQLEQLTTGGGGNPAWSPDGTRIAHSRYVDDRPDGNAAFDVVVMNADGSGEVNLTNGNPEGYESYGNASWAPDGTKVAFDGGGGDPFLGALYVANPDGTARTAITEPVPGDEAAFDADWQPVGGAAQPTAGITPVATDSSDDDGDGDWWVWVVVPVVGAWAVVGAAFVFFRRFSRR
jgi:Tol biopolymer transport system component